MTSCAEALADYFLNKGWDACAERISAGGPWHAYHDGKWYSLTMKPEGRRILKCDSDGMCLVED